MGTEWLKYELSGPRYFVQDFVEIMSLFDMTYDLYFVQSKIKDYPKLEIENIITTSFEITLTGLYDGIDKLAELLKVIPELFTSTYWGKKREELRNKILSNDLIEIEIQKKKVELMAEIIKLSKEIPENELRPYILKNLTDIPLDSEEFKKESEKNIRVNFLSKW